MYNVHVHMHMYMYILHMYNVALIWEKNTCKSLKHTFIKFNLIKSEIHVHAHVSFILQYMFMYICYTVKWTVNQSTVAIDMCMYTCNNNKQKFV